MRLLYFSISTFFALPLHQRDAAFFGALLVARVRVYARHTGVCTPKWRSKYINKLLRWVSIPPAVRDYGDTA